ncbi:MAG: copper resistance protein CopC [Actinomycetota bacterium]
MSPLFRSATSAFVLVILLALPLPADAHAGVVAANPSPGSGIPQAPGEVVMSFSEPLNLKLSRVDVEDGDGRSVVTGPTLGVEGDPRAMRRKLALLEPGQYVVRWRTLSTVDGHALRGSYTFGVGIASSANETIENNPTSSEGWLGLLGRFFALVGLTMWVGSAALGGVAQRAGLEEQWLGRIASWAPLLVAIGTSLSVASLTIRSTGTLAEIGGLLFSGTSGPLRAGLIGVSVLASFAASRFRKLALLLLGTALVLEVASGHAASSATPLLTILLFGVHLVAAGVWVFSIAGSLLSSINLRIALAAFSPFAIGAAWAVALTGVATAALELRDPRDLVSTGYGKVVLGKAFALAAMAAFGLIHHYRRKSDRFDILRLRSPLRLEAIAAATAIALATLLVGFPDPPREAESAEPLGNIDPILTSLGRRDALSVADASGPFVVGLTLLPPRPGKVEVRVQVLGAQPGDGLRDAKIEGTSDAGRRFDAKLQRCRSRAVGCFAAETLLPSAATWNIELSITSNRGMVSAQYALPLPAPNGSSEFEKALKAMETLTSMRIQERLRASVAQDPLISEYVFRAPDRFRFSLGGSERVVVGTLTFTRDNPSDRWKVEDSPSLAFRWPRGWFTSFWSAGSAAVRILGTDQVEGADCRVVAFVRPQLPAWFEICIGEDDGLVRRMMMRAEGHLMEQDLSGFDDPVDINPPTELGRTVTRNVRQKQGATVVP